MFIKDKDEKPVEEVPLHLKYRPHSFDAVLGQETIIASLKSLFPSRVPHAFLFTGPSGCGKTTLSRIIASELGVDKNDIMEVDVAVVSGVDSMRDLLDGLQYKSMGSNGKKVVILDEIHMASKAAFNSILKVLEEPPKHVYWVLCTTESSKIPETIKTRCHSYTLKEVGYNDLVDLVNYVAEEEQITLPQGALDVIVRKAEGSPRKALVCLSQARACSTTDEVISILQSIKESEVIELCRLLVDRNKSLDRWAKAMKILNDLKEADSESIRIPVVKYLGSCIRKSKTDKDALFFDNIMTAFLNPTSKATGMEEVVHSCIQIIFDNAN